MKRIISTLLFAALSIVALKAQDYKSTAEVHVAYLNEYPYMFEENGKIVGLEADILREFTDWLKKHKQIDATLTFEAKSTFAEVYNAAKNDGEDIGSASITITKERAQEVSFSPAYLKNASVLITASGVQTLENYGEIPEKFDGMTALVRLGTTHEEELKKIKAFHHSDMVVKYVDTKDDMRELLASGEGKYFAVIDLITFWRWRTRDGLDIKMHSIATVKNEEFGFAFNQASAWQLLFDEFFNTGFKFTARSEYQEILEKYLGPEIMETVRAK